MSYIDSLIDVVIHDRGAMFLVALMAIKMWMIFGLGESASGGSVWIGSTNIQW